MKSFQLGIASDRRPGVPAGRPGFPAAPGGAARWLTISLWSLAGLVAGLSSWAALTRPAPDRLADLHVYYGAVEILHRGGSLYDFAAHNGAPFTYPPFAGLVFSPLGLVPEEPLRWLWTAATLAVVLLVARVALHRRAVPAGGPVPGSGPLAPRHIDGAVPADNSVAPDGAIPPNVAANRSRLGGPGVPAVVLLLFLSAPVSSNIRFGQVSLLLTALILLDCLRLLPERYRGVATGLAGAVKLTPMVFVPYWWFSGQRRTAVVATATFVVATVLGWIVLPGESERFWLTEIWNVDRVGNIDTTGNQSINGALLRWDVPDTPRTILMAVFGLTVLVLAFRRARRTWRDGHPLAAAVIVGCAGVAFSPVSWTHHQTWLVLAALLAVSDRPAVNRAWMALVAALMILPVGWLAVGPVGEAIAGNARLLLAIAVACAVPVRSSPDREPGVRKSVDRESRTRQSVDREPETRAGAPSGPAVAAD